MNTLALIYIILSGVYLWAGVLFLGFWRSVSKLTPDSKKYLYFSLINFSLVGFTFNTALNEIYPYSNNTFIWTHLQWISVIPFPIFLNLFLTEICKIKGNYLKFLTYVYTPFCLAYYILFFIPGLMITDQTTLHQFNIIGYNYSQPRILLGPGLFYFIIIAMIVTFWTITYCIQLFSKNRKHLSILIYMMLFILLAVWEVSYLFIKGNYNFSIFIAPTFWSITILIFLILMTSTMFLEVMEIGRTAKEKNQELSRTNEEIGFLMGTISHDIKGPLLSISGFVELLENKSSLDKIKLRHYLDRIHTNANHIKLLLKDLASYAKIGRIQEEIEKVDLKEAIEQAITILDLDRYYPQLSFDVIGDTPPIFASKKRIKEIIINLIQNSVKYLPKEKGEIRIRLEEVKGGTLLRCEDNGSGIPKELQEKVFEKFFRHIPKEPGTGMGLTIVKKIVESFYGNVWIDPEYQQGTCICIFLPNLKTFYRTRQNLTFSKLA